MCLHMAVRNASLLVWTVSVFFIIQTCEREMCVYIYMVSICVSVCVVLLPVACVLFTTASVKPR